MCITLSEYEDVVRVQSILLRFVDGNIPTQPAVSQSSSTYPQPNDSTLGVFLFI